MRLSQHTIDEIRSRMDIEEVVSDYVSLKKKGKNMWACCPFHQEKTPSFSIAPEKGIFKCFGCGKAGDPLTFIMEIEGLGYVEALRHLAGKYGITIEEESPEQRDAAQEAHNEKESLLIVLAFAARYFEQQLWESESGQSIGYSYFRERGFSDGVIKKFNLGYSQEAWDGLLKAALEEGFSEDILEQAGLIIRKEEGNKKYDRFRGRVIFPIHNLSGKPIAFGARMLGKDKKQPKYLNSPETAVYHKSGVLYGIHQARQAIRQHDVCYLVEGYTDVISLHLCEIANVVASSGTSLTEGQIRLISRFTKNITVLYDGDAAGIKASLRGIDLIVEQGLQVRVVRFPEGEDPDSYSQQLGTEAFKKFLDESAEDFVKFKTRLVVGEAGQDPIRRAEAVREVVDTLAKVQDPVLQAFYRQECSRLLEVDEELLLRELNKKSLRSHTQPENMPPDIFQLPPEPEPGFDDEEPGKLLSEALKLQEEESVRLLLNYGQFVMEDEEKLCHFLLGELEEIDFQTPVYQKILEHFRQELEAGRMPEQSGLLQHPASDVREAAANMLSQRYELSDVWETRHGIPIPREEERLDKAVFQNVLRVKIRLVQKLISENMEQLKSADEAGQLEILAIHQELKKTEMELAKLLGTVIR